MWTDWKRIATFEYSYEERRLSPGLLLDCIRASSSTIVENLQVVYVAAQSYHSVHHLSI
jgi:hypothetical protein